MSFVCLLGIFGSFSFSVKGCVFRIDGAADHLNGITQTSKQQISGISLKSIPYSTVIGPILRDDIGKGELNIPKTTVRNFSASEPE